MRTQSQNGDGSSFVESDWLTFVEWRHELLMMSSTWRFCKSKRVTWKVCDNMWQIDINKWQGTVRFSLYLQRRGYTAKRPQVWYSFRYFSIDKFIKNVVLPVARIQRMAEQTMAYARAFGKNLETSYLRLKNVSNKCIISVYITKIKQIILWE